MSNFILDNTASDINTALGKVLNLDTSPTDTDALITSGGVKAYVDTEISAINTITTAEVAKLSEDFYKETITATGTVSSSTTLATFTAPEDGLYVGVLVGTYYFSSSAYNSIFLYWQNVNEVFDPYDPTSGWVQVNAENSSARFAFTREPVAMLQGQTIKLKSRLFGNQKTATYDLTFKITRLA